MKLLAHLSNELSDMILLYSPYLEKEWQFERWHDKIRFSPVQHVDFNLFRRTVEFHSRPSVVGFVGRLGQEKGILNLMQAITAIVQRDAGIQFMIIGDGPLKDTIAGIVEREKLGDHVSLEGWAGREEIPEYLNRMRLLIVPSYTEGLPNVVLESMACGTPVLVSSVGSIPDIITEGKTGYLLHNNTPKSIEDEILRLFEGGDLDSVVIDAEVYVRNTFSLSAARTRVQKLLYSYS